MTTIIWAGVALTDAHSAAQTDHAVCVEGNRIIAAGPRSQLQTAYPEADQVGGAQYLLVPGFTNSHDHGRGLGTFPLGTGDDLLEIWLPGLFSQPPIDPYLLSAWEGIQLLRSGVTLTAHSHNPQDWHNMAAETAAVLRGYGEAGVRVAFHPPMTDQNQLVYADRDGFLAGLPSTLQEAAQGFLARNPLRHADYFDLCHQLYRTHHDPQQYKVHIQVSPAGGQWCSDALILAAVEFARQHQTRLQMHMLETRYQRHYAWQKWGKSFIAHLAEVGALGPWLTLAHMIWTEPEDIPLLREHGVGIAHNPGSNLRLRSGVAPLPAYLDAGIALGIGMDGQTLDDDQDYLREMRLALTLANRPGATSATVTAQDILHMGLGSGAAITMGAATPRGTLAPGALADLARVDWATVQHPWTTAWMPVAEVLLRKASKQHVREVMVGGEWVVRNGRAMRLDEAALATAIRDELNRFPQEVLVQRAAAAAALAPYLRRFYAAWDAAPMASGVSSTPPLQTQVFF